MKTCWNILVRESFGLWVVIKRIEMNLAILCILTIRRGLWCMVAVDTVWLFKFVMAKRFVRRWLIRCYSNICEQASLPSRRYFIPPATAFSNCTTTAETVEGRDGVPLGKILYAPLKPSLAVLVSCLIATVQVLGWWLIKSDNIVSWESLPHQNNL